MHSKSIISFALAPLVLPALARPSCKSPAANGKAIYMISNEPENAVLALPIGRDGLFAEGTATLTATGGAGMNGRTADNQTAAPDALFSQGSVTIAGNHLFAVNPGSNTVSMFAIHRQDPTKLTPVGRPAAVPGEFPVTVAASARHGVVCVGTSGAAAGVSCAPFSARRGVGAMDGLRAFALGQTTPPVGPTNTVSHVFFSAGDESTVFATVKGDPAANKTGFLAAFPVLTPQQSDCQAAAAAQASVVVGQTGTRSSPAGTAVLFGSSTIAGSDDLFVTDASFGAAVLTRSGGGSGGGVDDAASVFTVKGKGVVDGQSATCWAAVSPATGTAFVTDVGVNRLVEMSLEDASVRAVVDLAANGDPGLTDLRAAGGFVYALSPGNGTTPAAVTVVDAVARKQVQHFQLKSMAFGKNAQGMAVLL